MWMTMKEAGRPWPVICEDDVVDYQIMEAVFIKVKNEELKAAKKAEREAWKEDLDELREYAGG